MVDSKTKTVLSLSLSGLLAAKQEKNAVSISFFGDLIAIKEEKKTTGKISERSKGILETYRKVLSLLGDSRDIINELLENAGIAQSDLVAKPCECVCISKLSNEDVYKKLTANQKEYISNKLRMERVKEDIKDYVAEDDDCVIPDAERKSAIASIDDIADKAAIQFTKECGDRNSSYWINIERLTVKAWRELKN